MKKSVKLRIRRVCASYLIDSARNFKAADALIGDFKAKCN